MWCITGITQLHFQVPLLHFRFPDPEEINVCSCTAACAVPKSQSVSSNGQRISGAGQLQIVFQVQRIALRERQERQLSHESYWALSVRAGIYGVWILQALWLKREIISPFSPFILKAKVGNWCKASEDEHFNFRAANVLKRVSS